MLVLETIWGRLEIFWDRLGAEKVVTRPTIRVTTFFWSMLESIWGRFRNDLGRIWERFWGRLGIDLGSISKRFGMELIDLGSIWD